jgi:hypothetical protein
MDFGSVVVICATVGFVSLMATCAFGMWIDG